LKALKNEEKKRKREAQLHDIRKIETVEEEK
jgi:hypothetical protein